MMGDVSRIPILLRSSRFSLIGIEITITGWKPLPDNQTWFDFEFHCLHCGGYEMNLPGDPVDSSDAKCSACDHRYATYGQIRELCTMLGKRAAPHLAG